MGASPWHVEAVSMAGNQVTKKTRSASSSATFCHPQKCDLASQAFAVDRSSRALCDSSLWWPWAIIRTHFIILMKKLSSHCYEKKDCLISLGCQVPYQTWCVMPAWRDHVITVVFVAPQVSESCKLLVRPWIGKVQPGWCWLVSCFLWLDTCLSWINTGNIQLVFLYCSSWQSLLIETFYVWMMRKWLHITVPRGTIRQSRL